ncbi:hypothetical protein BH18ACT1_BH18ACT1_18500 [soil metagenome]
MEMADGNVVVVAVVRTKEGKQDEAIEVVRSFLEPSHAEEGCLRYALHRDTSDPRRFVLVEHWRSQADLDSHFTKPHMANIGKLNDLVEGAPDLIFLAPVPLGDDVKGQL